MGNVGTNRLGFCSRRKSDPRTSWRDQWTVTDLTNAQNGVPFSNYFSVVDARLDFPVRTTCAAVLFAAIYGLLYLASTTAFNSIVTSAVLFLNITYAVPQAILLVQGRAKSLPARYLNLGKFGYFCNAFSMLWIVVLGVFICFPPTLPVAVGSMNYTSVILVGLFLVIIGLWFVIGRKNFHGPKIDWELMNEANRAAGKEK
jgi:choline transport protein